MPGPAPDPDGTTVTVGVEHALVNGIVHKPVAVTQIGDRFLLQVGAEEVVLNRGAARRIGRVLLFDPPAADAGTPDNQHDSQAPAPRSQHDDGLDLQSQIEGRVL